MSSVFVHIVTFNSPDCTFFCVQALHEQKGFKAGQNIFLNVTDNASSNGLAGALRDRFGALLSIRQNEQNLGFCAGHNQGVKLFLEGAADYLLILNPDLRLENTALGELVSALERHKEAGMACAKLFRADDSLKALEPPTLDSAGMYVTPTLRHFDRGSDLKDTGQYDRPAFVFGGTGACLLLRRDFVRDAVLCGERYDRDLSLVFPQGESAGTVRPQLFDEAFFAYREDADLAWRAQRLGWKCIYTPAALGYHRRVVVAERRRTLPPELNLMGVRNRFLLQLNNFSFCGYPGMLLPGIMLRNLIVLLGVLLRERSSLPALFQVLKLWRRALERNALMRKRSRVADKMVARWFRTLPYAEPAL